MNHETETPNIKSTERNLGSRINDILSANDSVDNFDYLESIGNWNIIQNINSYSREELLAKEKEYDLRITLITASQVDTEVQ